MDGMYSAFGAAWDQNFSEDRENGFFHGLYEPGNLMTDYPDISSASMAQHYGNGPSMSGDAFQDMTFRDNDFSQTLNSHGSTQQTGSGGLGNSQNSMPVDSNAMPNRKRRKLSKQTKPSKNSKSSKGDVKIRSSQDFEHLGWQMGLSKSDYLKFMGLDSVDLDHNDNPSTCSSCPASCPSHCGETGQGSICCDAENCDAPTSEDLCVDEACAGANNPCTDQNCFGDTLPAAGSKEEAAAAAALTSFGDLGDYMPGQAVPDGLQSGHMNFNAITDMLPFDFNGQIPEQDPDNGGCLDTSGAEQFCLPPSSETFGNTATLPWASSWDLLYHLKNFHHSSKNSTTHVRPCAADNPAFARLKCPLPADPNCSQTFAQPTPFSDDHSGHQCGFSAKNPSMFADHLTNFHGSFLQSLPSSNTAWMPDSNLGLVGMSQVQRKQIPQTYPRAFGVNMPFAGHALDASPSHSQMERRSSHLLTPDTLSSVPNSPHKATAAEANHKIQSLDPQQAYQCRWRHPETGAPCLQNFGDADALDAHCKAEHTKNAVKHEGGFKCLWEYCKREGDFFTTRAKLNRHLQTHTGFKPMECPICHMKLSAKQALDQHIRTHTNEKPYTCSYNCGATFKQHSALTMHHRTHTKEKPLKCDLCGAVFTESSNLSKHKRTHDVKGSFVCGLCSKDFHRLDQLRRHFSSNHKDEPMHLIEQLLNVATTKSKKIRQSNRTTAASRSSASPANGMMATRFTSSPTPPTDLNELSSGNHSVSSDSFQDVIKSEDFGMWQ